jgi:hypothetical protein
MNRSAKLLSAESITNPKSFEARVCEAIRSSGGNVSEAARVLGVSRRTLHRYITDRPSLENAVDEERARNDTEKRAYDRYAQARWRAQHGRG